MSIFMKGVFKTLLTIDAVCLFIPQKKFKNFYGILAPRASNG